MLLLTTHNINDGDCLTVHDERAAKPIACADLQILTTCEFRVSCEQARLKHVTEAPKVLSGSRAGNNRKKDVSNSKGRDAGESNVDEAKEKQAFDMQVTRAELKQPTRGLRSTQAEVVDGYVVGQPKTGRQ